MEQKTTKISFWERFSYGCGDLGCNIIYSAMSAFLLFYYTDYVHISAGIVGTIMLVSRIFDGFTDLIMGVIVDRTKSKWGNADRGSYGWQFRLQLPESSCSVYRQDWDRQRKSHTFSLHIT